MLADRVRSATGKKKGIWVACSDEEIYSSKDGIDWRKTADIGIGQQEDMSLVYANGLWVVAQYNRIITSTNGINWEIQNTVIDGRIIALAYGNGVWVGVDDYKSKMYISTDLISWESYYASGIYDVEDIDYDNGIFTIIGRNRYATSNDGRNWTVTSLSTTYERIRFIKALDGHWFMFGNKSTSGDFFRIYFTHNQIETGSTSAKVWSGGGLSGVARDIASDNDSIYIIVGDGSYALKATNGIGSSLRNKTLQGPYDSASGIEYANGTFVVVGSRCKYSLDNGDSWNNTNLPDYSRIDCIKYGGD